MGNTRGAAWMYCSVDIVEIPAMPWRRPRAGSLAVRHDGQGDDPHASLSCHLHYQHPASDSESSPAVLDAAGITGY